MARKKSATLQKVAETTGVSVSTVSRILNHSDFATQETRDRVIKAAARMGYTQLRRPDITQPITSLGKSRPNGSLENIVLLAPENMLDRLESQEWIWRDVVPTLQRIAKKRGFHLTLSSYGQDDQWNPAAITAQNISGVLWMAHDRQDLLARISKTVPVIVINDDTLWPPQTCVLSSNRMVLFKAVEHLVELKHQHIAYFDVDENSSHCRQRLAAYHEAIAHFQANTDPALCVREQFGRNEHPQAIAKAMDRMAKLKPKATALIAPLRYSIEFLKEARKRNLTVPDDLSIVAIDNAPAAEWVDPSLTTIDCLFGRCAETAIELLIDEKQNARESVRTILTEPKLIVRNSTCKNG